VKARVARADELDACIEIRREVFVVGQNVPLELEVDGLDPDLTHFVAWSGGVLLGTARMMECDGYAKAQRVAVLASARGQGIGAALMEALEHEARRRGFDVVRLGAQCTVIEFYERIGYSAYGPVFLDAGIDHREMSKTLG